MSNHTCPDCGERKANPVAIRCRSCYRRCQSLGLGRTCTFQECRKKHYGKGLCFTHYVRATRGYPMDGHRAQRNPYIEANGYVLEYRPDHPMVNKAGYMFQHRLVMEQMVGRPLLPSENVHHINGKRDDNRPENLELWSKSQPSGQRVVDKVAWAIELLALYQPEVLASSPVQLRSTP